MDNVIYMNDYILPEIKSKVMENRKIGLGVMGWANALILLQIPYASNEAISLANQLMKFINDESKQASFNLANEKGVFKNWENSIYYPHTPLRNATRTSIAPTGTISILANTSSSIEPLFSLAIRREHVLNDEILYETNSLFMKYCSSKNIYTNDLEDTVKKNGSIALTNLPNKVKELFKTSHEISVDWHLKHQFAFQNYTDNAVSKTINLPENASVKDVSEAYLKAWKQGVKGITVFRDNSRQTQVLNKGYQIEKHVCKICSE